MRLKLLDTVLCRTPAFSIEDNIEDRWIDLKNLIHESSPSFYDIIQYIDFQELNTISEKVDFSIWKYFNRARYRATPFGGFAAFTPLPVSIDNPCPSILNHKMVTHNFIDWKEKDRHFTNFNELVNRSSWFQANSSIYSVGNELRYIRFKDGRFEIATIINFPELASLINLCNNKTNKGEIYRLMRSDFRMPKRTIQDLLVQSLELQLLLTEQYPNITGEDYFKRIKIDQSASINSYSISERNLVSGNFDCKKIKSIPAYVDFLSINLSPTINANLNEFRNSFLKRFEQAAIPIAVVMDPEVGIGYGNLEHNEQDGELLDILDSVSQNNPPEQILYTAFHRYLLNGLIKGNVIRLEEFEGPHSGPAMQMPNSFSAMVRYYEGQPVVEHTGGCTANSLMGRFTMASSELEGFAQSVSVLEEKANPDILFFDIAYQVEKQIDNVNRRKQLYKNELPILTWSTDPSPISFEDILVTVRGAEIVLWSRKHNKRMIPRIPSAYNYARSDLAVYRFLCDLQHQGISSNLDFKIQHIFPKLDHYSRIVFRDIIVSPAMWLVPKKILESSQNNNQLQAILENWFANNGIKAGHTDQTLCFDPKIEADRKAFIFYCRQSSNKDIYISEALLSTESDIKDENGKSYAAEYIISYGHDDAIYKAFKNVDNSDDALTPLNAISLPGGDWLYFEIYCNPSRSNAILLNQISLFLKQSMSELKKWFFIRYEDPKPHIRLRLNVKEISDCFTLINRFKSLVDKECFQGLISDVQIKTYFREIERYGAKRIDLVEKIFCIDSKYTLLLLSRVYTTEELYAITLVAMRKIIAINLKNNISAQLVFVKTIADNFSAELRMDRERFKKLNQAYQKQKTISYTGITSRIDNLFRRYEKLFSAITNHCDNDAEKAKITADLLHMHINRLFISNQRVHEGILYHYLLKEIKTHQATSTVLPEYSV